MLNLTYHGRHSMATVRNEYDMWPLSNLELINNKDISGNILKKNPVISS